MERQQARSDSVLAGGQHSLSMSNIGEPVDAIEPVPVDVIDGLSMITSRSKTATRATRMMTPMILQSLR
jgi:hypothetical protein